MVKTMSNMASLCGAESEVFLYADGASLEQIGTLPDVDGYTFNPSLMRKAGITRMNDFAKAVLERTKDPVSFEVLADDFDEMERQAHEIQSWGDNVWVKIPITNTKGESSIDLIDRISDLNINITAVFTWKQLNAIKTVDRPHHIISVFAGRIQDTGKDVPFVRDAGFHGKFLWASTRSTNDLDKSWMGYSIYTLSPELIKKLPLRGKDLEDYSLETVRQFYEDGKLCVV